ncbi:MAG: DUF1851 domain-containing protein [Gammaproteobacteria bacterium]|nr:DUF1851 domain-containing protein [Gammaproteobacteria bacterium]
MDISDYLIEQQGKDWAKLLSDWAWLLPNDLTVWMVNRFGDIVLVLDDGTVHFLDVGAGTLKQIAETREDFCVKVDADDNAGIWFLISLVDECAEAGMSLSVDQCYTFKLAPVFGGQYSIENIEVGDLEVNYSLLGQTHDQIKDLPDGSTVNIVVST